MMESDIVTLIVKAPNQQIEDQIINCESSWKIRQLKGHLSEVYPSKPKTDEQKIIYSGQLLDDNCTLKDILRIYDGQTAHTMHLVCTPKRFKTQQAKAPADDGLRRRNLPETRASQQPQREARTESRQNVQNHSAEMQNMFTNFVYRTGVNGGYYGDVTNQMAAMQNVYIQYMQQYATMWQAAMNNPSLAAAMASNPAFAQNIMNQTQPDGVPPMANHQPILQHQQAAAVAPQHQPVVNAEGANDEGAPPDWLDHVYLASRLLILFSLVYFYSSPVRFLLVVMLSFTVYLYQIGFFRHLGNNNERLERQQEANRDVDQSEEQEESEEVIAETETQENEESQQTQNENNTTSQIIDNPQNGLTFYWTIVSSFFTSLIPEAPNAI